MYYLRVTRDGDGWTYYWMLAGTSKTVLEGWAAGSFVEAEAEAEQHLSDWLRAKKEKSDGTDS